MTRLKVAVRVRPLSNREIEEGSCSIVAVENSDSLAVTNIKVPEQNAGDSRERVRRFTFDRCFQEDATQDTIFDTVETVIGKSVKERCHSCVLAYGQSSSGKTHTMMGFSSDPGLTPKLCDRLFGYLKETAVGNEYETMKVTVSYLEIYNEKVKDLLCSEEEFSKKNHGLRIREHPKKGPYVQGLSEHTVTSSSDLLAWLDKGNSRRRVASTLSNPQSSRSHSVFSINCDGVKLNLIDLAGSERANNRCFNLSRFKEGANINKSLVALGNVISALADRTIKLSKGIRRRFVPYRDSVLTWLLKDTLGGNSNTVMVATISPSSLCYTETVNTLRFGQRAKLIVCERRLDVLEDPREKTIRELRAEIVKLRELLKGLGQDPKYLPINPMNQIDDASNNDINSLQTTVPDQFKDITDDISQTQPTVNDDSIKQTEGTTDPPKTASQESIDKTQITTEKLVPLIDVSSSVPKPTELKRTFSVDRGLITMDREKLKLFGSNDSIPSPGTKSVVSTPSSEKDSLPSSDKSKNSVSSQPLRRKSLSKAVPSLPKTPPKRGSLDGDPKKMEKSISTESLKKTASKVDLSKKPATARPRSQIVAAVTSRLYSKIRKKEAATDTSDLEVHLKGTPKELAICLNARKKLQELTKRALRANKTKSEETQTELFPVRRVKERATDSSDLKLSISEVKEVSTMSEVAEMKNASVECIFLDRFGEEMYGSSHVSFTRTCGTQSTPDDFRDKKLGHQPISFTKYLRELQDDVSASSIYTHSVNINISNNYVNGSRVSTSSSSSSDDSLEQVGLPTPDLISNHNSLEPQSQSPREAKLLHATLQELEEEFLDNDILILPPENRTNRGSARKEFVSKMTDNIPKVNLEKSYAPEICTRTNHGQFCEPLPRFRPRTSRALQTVCENEANQRPFVLRRPVVLKSIVKDNISSEEELKVHDSLDYHMANKKVKFSEKSSHERRMYRAMSEFLEEATQLMSKIDKCTSTLFDSNYEIEVTVSDARGGVRRPIKKTRRKLERPRSAVYVSHLERKDDFSQTLPFKVDISTQSDNAYAMPVNKYEALLEETCRRLEEKIEGFNDHPRRTIHDDFADLFNLDQNNSEVEDSSLESNAMAFSDYGSLPRRTHKRYRRPACSPSAFLKQLTNMRKQIIKSSREDLMSNASCSH